MTTNFYKFSWLLTLFIFFIPGRNIFYAQSHQFNYDYSQTLVIKMFLADPDKQEGTNVYCDFGKALDLIRQADNITLGVPKIIYLVGWQYRGHDDLYPAFFEVNPALKRPGDTNARESLLWLMKEARKYHTAVSLHINMTDAYENSPLWKEYVDNDLISKNADGSLMVIGNYNGRKAYQINYRNEWEKGYAQMRIDRLIELLPPLKEAGSIHLDAWIARENKGEYESNVLEAKYQEKVCNYWRSKGIDVTSEWVMDYMTGLVPYYLHFNHRTQQDYLRIPANLLTGSHMNPDLQNSDFDLEFLFGTSMYGSNLFPNPYNKVPDAECEALFTRDFYLNFVQYYYLNRMKRLRVEGEKKGRVAYFSDSVKVSIADSTIFENNRQLMKGNTLCFPALWRSDNSLVAFSEKKTDLIYSLPDSWKNVKVAGVFLISKSGLMRKGEIEILNNQLKLVLSAGQPLLIMPAGSTEPSGAYYDWTITKQPERPYFLKYDQSIVYQLILAMKSKGGNESRVFLNYAQALDVIRRFDILTCGAPKIVYLCGAQNNGHDSKYPYWGAFNDALKRPEDKTGLDGLKWLMAEARKYNTIVSLQLNMLDAYEDSPLYNEYVEKDIICKDKQGHVIDGPIWDGQVSHPISYKKEWDLGLAKKRIDLLLSLLPELKESHAVLIDCFITWSPVLGDQHVISPYLGYTSEQEAEAQRKIIRYFRDQGIDVSDEYYRSNRVDPFIGLQASAATLNAPNDIDTYVPPHLACGWAMSYGNKFGGQVGVALMNDPKGFSCLTGTVNPWLAPGVKEEFAKMHGLLDLFCIAGAPFIWCNHWREADDTKQPSEADWNRVKQGNDICIPLTWKKEKTLLVYSRDGYSGKTWIFPGDWKSVKSATSYRILPDGSNKEDFGTVEIKDGQITLTLKPGEAFELVAIE
jgi:hypothetical protein